MGQKFGVFLWWKAAGCGLWILGWIWGILGQKLGIFWSEIWFFFVVKGGWLRPVHFGVKSGHFGVEIWGFGIRNLGFWGQIWGFWGQKFGVFGSNLGF